jgi:hypothetical protein
MEMELSNERLAELLAVGPLVGGIGISETVSVLAELQALRASSGVEVKPYAYEFGKSNGDGTYSVVIERCGPDYVNRFAVPDWEIKPLYASPLPTVEVTEGEAPMIMRMVAVGNALAGWMDMSNPGAKTDWAKWRDASAEALNLATAALSQNKGE